MRPGTQDSASPRTLWKNEKNISKCRLLIILPRVLGINMVCTNKLHIGLCMANLQ